jgi:3-phenylpropionate/trans-cinnamate dioxygenase ferredoxin reductase component
MEYAGWVDARAAGSPVIRGDLAARQFHAFWLVDDVVVAGMRVNSWDDGIKPVQDLIRARVRVDPQRLVDRSIPLTDLVQ